MVGPLRIAFVFFIVSGCGFSATRTEVNSAGRYSTRGYCLGVGCAPDYGLGNAWVPGIAPPYPFSPSDARFGAVEAYRARNRWVRTPSSTSLGTAPSTSLGTGEARDPRVAPLIREVQRQNNVLRELEREVCENSDDECATDERSSR